MQERVVGLDDLTFDIREVDPNDVSFDQTPNLRLTFCKIAIQACVLQRDRSLRGQQVEHRDPGRCEYVARQIILKI
jgi:hypothetical protein